MEEIGVGASMLFQMLKGLEDLSDVAFLTMEYEEPRPVVHLRRVVLRGYCSFDIYSCLTSDKTQRLQIM